MYKICIRCFFINFLLLLSSSHISAKDCQFDMETAKLDFIMQRVFEFAPFYSKLIDEYDAELYLKAKLQIHEKNELIKVVPSMFRFEKNVDEYIVESISELRYTAPNIYDRKIKALVSTFPQNADYISDFMDFLNVNAYAPTLMEDKILMPIDKECSKYYDYSIDSIADSDGMKFYKISISPKFKSTQLVSGFFWVKEETWTIRELCLIGKFDLFRFKMYFEMGEEGDKEFLPQKVNLNINFNFLKNHWEMNVFSLLKYNKVSFIDANKKIKKIDRPCYDLTEKYKLTSGNSDKISSLEVFNSLRPILLSASEDSLYKAFEVRKSKLLGDSIAVRNQKKKEFWGQVGDAMLFNYKVNLSGIGSIRCSPLINPMTLNYSHNKGFSFRQKFKYNRLFSDGKLVRIVPQFGYNFTYNYWLAKLNANFVYWPQKNGGFELNVGNDSRVYRSVDVEHLLLDVKDDLGLMDLARLNYYNEFYLNLYHQFEIINGLNIKTGVKYHFRHYAKDVKRDFDEVLKEESLVKKIKTAYKSFSPNIRIEWTPGLYYYMNGNRKMNIATEYPTFILDYEHGVKGLWGGKDSHERIEFDIQQIMKLGKLKSFAYRAGGGIYTRKPESSFYNFADFSRGSIPDNFTDEIGGTFQILKRQLFYTYDNYWRGNFTYESPFIFLRPLNRWLGMVQHERLYGGVLFMPNLNPYLEFGYGVGTHVFDFGIFVGLQNGKFDGLGFKLTFELFND